MLCYLTLRFLLYSTLLFSTVLYSLLLYSTLLYSSLHYSTLLYTTLLFSTLLCSSLRYSQGFRLRPERPVVFYSMSGTLISIFDGFFYHCIIIICFYLSISWICWLEDNRILQLNSSKLPHYFFLCLSSGMFDWFPVNWGDHFVFIPARPSWKGNPQAKHTTRVCRTSIGEMKRISEGQEKTRCSLWFWPWWIDKSKLTKI